MKVQSPNAPVLKAAPQIATPAPAKATQEGQEVQNTQDQLDVNAAAPSEEPAAPAPAQNHHHILKAAGFAAAAGLAVAALPALASAATSSGLAAAGPIAAAAGSASMVNVGQILGIAVPVAMLGYFGYSIYTQYKANHVDDPSPSGGDDETISKVTFKDVAGIPEAKEELMEVVDFLKNPGKYAKMGAHVPKGVLLSGPPGNGKTLLAKAVAGEAGVKIFTAAGSDFVEKYVGVGAQRVRDLFKKAAENAPCIVFIDEIDALGGKRGGGNEGNQEHDSTLNALLVQMDGINSAAGVVVLGATNRPDMLDAALLRPGRLSRKVEVTPPNKEGRLAILQVHAKDKPLENPEDLKVIVDRSLGMSGAELAETMNEAAIMAVRRNHEKITLEDMSEALDRVNMGPQKKSAVMSQEERELTAYHESGHATISAALPANGHLQKVSILPRGHAGGVTWTVPDKDTSYSNKQDMLDQIARCMGGRAGELLWNGNIGTGPSSDLERATTVAKQMVMNYAMYQDETGPMVYLDPRSREDGLTPSPETQSKIDNLVQKILVEQFDRATHILTENKKAWTHLATELLVKEELDRPELDALFAADLVKPTNPPTDPPASDKKAA